MSGLKVRGRRRRRRRRKEDVRVGKETTIWLKTFLMMTAGAFSMEEHTK